FRVGAPEVRLAVAGAQAATGSLTPVELPAGGTTDVTLSFRFDPLALGAAIAAQVQAASSGGAGLAVSLEGGWNLEAPGVATLSLQPTRLLDTVLRGSDSRSPGPKDKDVRAERVRSATSRELTTAQKLASAACRTGRGSGGVRVGG